MAKADAHTTAGSQSAGTNFTPHQRNSHTTRHETDEGTTDDGASDAAVGAPPVAVYEQTSPDEAAVTVPVTPPTETAAGSVHGTQAPSAPIDPPTPLTLLALTRRDVKNASHPQPSPTTSSADPNTTAVTTADDTARLVTASPMAATTTIEAPASDATYIGQPSLVNQVFVVALRVLKPFLSLVGIDLSGSSSSIPFFTDGKPPFFLTLGLGVHKTEVDGMDVWTITPRQPSGKVVVAVHGGGFIGQASIFHWATYAALARDTGATVIVPNYAVAKADGTGGTAATVVPTMTDFIAAQVTQYGPDNVSVLGDSAGGNIALVASQELVRRCNADPTCEDPHLPGRLVLIAPVLDVSMTNPAIKQVDDPLLNFDSSQRNGKLWAAGLGTPDDPDGTHNPLASPLFGSFEGLPPTTIYSGSLDLRSPDALVLQQNLASTPDTDFTFELRKGEIHDWIIFPFLPDAVREYRGVYQHLGLTDDV